MERKQKAVKLLADYLQNKATDLEKKQVDEWYESYAHKAGYLDRSKKVMLSKSIAKNIDDRINNSRFRKEKQSWLIFRLPLQVAASLLLVSFSIWMSLNAGSWYKETYETHVISTAANEKRIISLADGSELWLQPSSTIRYRGDFKSGKRMIQLLNGKVFFKVFRDPQRPFEVKMPEGFYTRVLGTSFSISVDKNKPVAVEVKSGKVAVGKGSRQFAELVKGQQITCGESRDKAAFKVSLSTKKHLHFEASQLTEVVKQLEWMFFIKIDLPRDPAIGKLKCTGSFTSLQDPEEILQTLCTLHQLQLVKQKNGKQHFKIL